MSALRAGSSATAAATLGNLLGPIETLAREQTDLAVVEPGLDAIAVELDLVHPALAARRRRAQGGERRRHEIRQRRAVRPRLLVLAFALAGAFTWWLFFAVAGAMGGCAPLVCARLARLRAAADALPLVAPALTLSFTLRFECQTRLRPLPSAISGIDRPLTTESGSPRECPGSSGAAGFARPSP